MVHFLALAVLAWANIHSPTPADGLRPQLQAQKMVEPNSKPTPEQRRWFERAIEHILEGEHR